MASNFYAQKFKSIAAKFGKTWFFPRLIFAKLYAIRISKVLHE